MAGRSFQKLLGAIDPNVVLLGISFLPQGTGAINATTQVFGRGVASVAWSTDRYIVTLQDVYPSLLAATVTPQFATAADQFCQLGAINLTNKTIEIVVWDVSANAAVSVAANAGNLIHLHLVLKNSSV
jgi:hypothetical protein